MSWGKKESKWFGLSMYILEDMFYKESGKRKDSCVSSQQVPWLKDETPPTWYILLFIKPLFSAHFCTAYRHYSHPHTPFADKKLCELIEAHKEKATCLRSPRSQMTESELELRPDCIKAFGCKLNACGDLPLSILQDFKAALDAARLIPLYYKRGTGHRHNNKVPP